MWIHHWQKRLRRITITGLLHTVRTYDIESCLFCLTSLTSWHYFRFTLKGRKLSCLQRQTFQSRDSYVASSKAELVSHYQFLYSQCQPTSAQTLTQTLAQLTKPVGSDFFVCCLHVCKRDTAYVNLMLHVNLILQFRVWYNAEQVKCLLGCSLAYPDTSTLKSSHNDIPCTVASV